MYIVILCLTLSIPKLGKDEEEGIDGKGGIDVRYTIVKPIQRNNLSFSFVSLIYS